MDRHTKIQFQTGYYHVAVIIKHKDANVMLNLDQTSYASKTIHIMLSHHKDPIPHSQYNSWNSHIVTIDIPQIKSKKKQTNS
jgi:hypothetical protein